jgi:peptide/nickel transport system permease protein
MLRFVAVRLVSTVPMLFFVSLVVFGLLAAAPGDPARQSLAIGGGADQVDDRDVAARRAELGLDRPIWQRYALWVSDIARLDLGTSYVNNRPVADLLAERALASATLAGVTLALSLALSIPLGVIAAIRVGTLIDALVSVVSLVGASLPGFWLALLAMWLFAAELQWFPALASFNPRGMVLPVAVLTVRNLGLLTRLTRATVLDALAMPHVQVARSRGLRERRVLVLHVLPNAMIPIITVIGLEFASLVAYVAVIEWVFAWPGIGRLGVDAALAGDAPVVLGFVLVVCFTVVLANLAADLAYGWVDPRQRETPG